MNTEEISGELVVGPIAKGETAETATVRMSGVFKKKLAVTKSVLFNRPRTGRGQQFNTIIGTVWCAVVNSGHNMNAVEVKYPGNHELTQAEADAIVAYLKTHTIRETATHFNFSTGWVEQISEACFELWRPGT